MRDLLKLGLTLSADELLAHRALVIANQIGLTTYDAVYVALAESLSVPLITADTKIAKLGTQLIRCVSLTDVLAGIQSGGF